MVVLLREDGYPFHSGKRNGLSHRVAAPRGAGKIAGQALSEKPRGRLQDSHLVQKVSAREGMKTVQSCFDCRADGAMLYADRRRGLLCDAAVYPIASGDTRHR